MASYKTYLPLISLFMLIFTAFPTFAAAPAALSPTPKDKCAVCGMFVAKYPNWAAGVFATGRPAAWFDGPKDMFRYVLNINKYSPKADMSKAEITVKDYYSLKVIDGRKAFYVVGSDVLGPMGPELVPFVKESDALGFMTDHAGKKMLRFGEVKAGMLEGM